MQVLSMAAHALRPSTLGKRAGGDPLAARGFDGVDGARLHGNAGFCKVATQRCPPAWSNATQRCPPAWSVSVPRASRCTLSGSSHLGVVHGIWNARATLDVLELTIVQ